MQQQRLPLDGAERAVRLRAQPRYCRLVLPLILPLHCCLILPPVLLMPYQSARALLNRQRAPIIRCDVWPIIKCHNGTRPCDHEYGSGLQWMWKSTDLKTFTRSVEMH